MQNDRIAGDRETRYYSMQIIVCIADVQLYVFWQTINRKMLISMINHRLMLINHFEP